VPEETSIDAEIDLCQGVDGYSLQARLNVSLPGMPRDVAQDLIDAADQTCPYSKALRGSVPTQVKLI
jgi:organic hydroperoxide reductase OsmC/OhrA